MVQVPISTQRRVQVQTEPRERFRYAEARNYIGPALQQAGAALGKAAKDWDEIEGVYDEADALNLDNMMAESVSATKSEFANMRGDAPARVLQDKVTDLEARREELLKGARSDRARKMADRAFSTRIRSVRETMTEHADREMFGFKDTALSSSIVQGVNDAVDARGTENFGVFMGAAMGRLEQKALHNGWSPEQTQLEAGKLADSIYSGVIYAIDAEDGEPTAALAYLDGVKDELSPGIEGKLREGLKPRVLGAQMDEVVRSGGLDQYMPAAPSAPAAGQGAGSAEPVTLAVPFQGSGTTVPGGRYGASRDYGGHSGVDYAGLPAGTAVPPSAVGTVRFAGQKGAYGNRVEIYHGKDAQGREIVTTYSHMDGVKVKEGEQVDASTVLGGVGSSGGNYGTHLHWEVLVGGQKVDPATVAGGITASPGTGGVPADPRLNSAAMRDAARAYADANNYTEEQREALFSSTERAVSQGRQDRAQTEQDADRRVMDWLTQNKSDPDSLTGMGQIPAAVLAGASPSTRAAIESRVQATADRAADAADRAAKERLAATERTAAIGLAELSDDELAGANLDLYEGIADPLLLARKRARQKNLNDKPAAVVSGDKIASMTNIAADILKINRETDPEEWAKLRDKMEHETRDMDPKSLTTETQRAIAIEQTQWVTLRGTGLFENDDVRRYELKDGQAYGRNGDSIPAGAMAYLNRNLPNGDMHQKVEAYERARAAGLDWAFK